MSNIAGRRGLSDEFNVQRRQKPKEFSDMMVAVVSQGCRLVYSPGETTARGVWGILSDNRSYIVVLVCLHFVGYHLGLHGGHVGNIDRHFILLVFRSLRQA